MSGKYADNFNHWYISKPDHGVYFALAAPDGEPWLLMPPNVGPRRTDKHKWFATWVQACDYVRAQCPLRVPHFPPFAPPAGFYEGLGQ